MSETIDILSFCRILIDLTNKDKCKWQPASHKSRDRLVFESGYFEITLYQETEQNKKCYCIDIYSNEDMQYMPFIAEKLSFTKDCINLFSITKFSARLPIANAICTLLL